MSENFQPMPDLSDEQFDALRADITAHGVLVPVVKDQHGRIIDGNNRSAIAAELGIDYPVQVVEVGDDNEAAERAVVLNCSRRHLTRAQVRTVIANEIRRCPDDSDRAIARRVGCSPSTVGIVRGQLSNLDTLNEEFVVTAHEMRVAAACWMVPLLEDDNGVTAADVRTAWKRGVDWLEMRGEVFPGAPAAAWLRPWVWEPLDDYLGDGNQWLHHEQHGDPDDEGRGNTSAAAVQEMDKLSEWLPLMAVVLREAWPDIFTDSGDGWVLSRLAEVPDDAEEQRIILSRLPEVVIE